MTFCHKAAVCHYHFMSTVLYLAAVHCGNGSKYGMYSSVRGIYNNTPVNRFAE